MIEIKVPSEFSQDADVGMDWRQEAFPALSL